MIDFSCYLKSSWIESKDYEPPFGHAEDVSLKILTRKTNINLEKAVVELKKQDVLFNTVDIKVKDIARANNLSPKDLYAIINKLKNNPPIGTGKKYTPEMVEEQFSGTGIGNKRLSWLLDELDISPEAAARRLQKSNIAMGGEETMKEAANRLNLVPLDILKVILIEDYSLPE